MKSAFVAILCLVIVSVSIAEDTVIWRQELSCDPNSRCKIGNMVVDKESNQVIILGTSELSDTKKADCWLWKIEPNGSVKHKQSLGLLSEYGSFMARLFGVKTSIMPNAGDIVRLKSDDANSMSLVVTDRNMQSSVVKLNTTARKQPGTLILHDMISCQNDNLLLVGQDGKDGIITRTDLAGNMIWEKTFDYGQIDILSSVAYNPDSNDFYVAGLSASMAGKMTFAAPATVCVLRYDGNGKLKASNYIEGGVAPWPSSLPKVICLPSGIVLVVYDKSMNTKTTDLYVKAYTPEFEVLYEKQILKTKEDGPPACFDICATREDHFVLACVINYWDLRLYECEIDGTILQTLELDREVGAGSIYVDYLVGKILVASATKLKENEKEAKIKLLALKPYKTN